LSISSNFFQYALYKQCSSIPVVCELRIGKTAFELGEKKTPEKIFKQFGLIEKQETLEQQDNKKKELFWVIEIYWFFLNIYRIWFRR